MRYFDFHADTLTEIKQGDLEKNTSDIDMTRICDVFETYVQVFAIWKDAALVKDTDKEFMESYLCAKSLLERSHDKILLAASAEEVAQALAEGKHAAMLSIEDVSYMGKYVRQCRELGFRFAMLTWNYENMYAYGAMANQSKGLKPAGKEIVAELDRQGVLLDLSHLSDAGVEDVFSLIDTPVLASHSNVRRICNAPRNLCHAHIRELIRRDGIIGLNLYRPFVAENQKVSIDDICRHVDDILTLGGENNLALGCDFDGCGGNFVDGITGVESLHLLYEAFCRQGYSEALIERLFFKNGYEFVQKYCQ